MPTFKGGGEEKNSEKGMRRQNGRSREVMARKAVRVSLKTWSDASSTTVCGYIKNTYIHIY